MIFLNKVFNGSLLKQLETASPSCQPQERAYSWNMVVNIVQTKRKPLEGIIDLQIKQIELLTNQETQQNDIRRLQQIQILIKDHQDIQEKIHIAAAVALIDALIESVQVIRG